MTLDVTLYGRPGCVYCDLAKQYLSDRHLRFRDRDISRDPRARQELERLGAPGVPVIIINGDAVLGFDKYRLDDLIKANEPFKGHPAKVP